MGKRILIIPDAYLKDHSGAYVTRIAKSLLKELGHTVAIFTHEINETITEEDGTRVYPRLVTGTMSQWLEAKYIKNYTEVLGEYRPDIIFTIGSVNNKAACYWRIARERGIKIISKIFMQDFFCQNYYANDEKGLCTRCLDGGPLKVFGGRCNRYTGNWLSVQIHKALAAMARTKMQKELVKTDAVITSSKQQVEFYVKYGIPRERCYITPLYFNGDKLKKFTPSMGDYYVFVAQNRIDKGIHLLKDVLANCNKDIKVIAAYTSQARIDEAIDKYGLRQYVENGILEMRPYCTWNTNLGELIAASRGVVNPSIWPTTTEYVLLETLGLKKPIFTFNVGIHPEIIETGVNGFVAVTPKEMAEQMNVFLYDDSKYMLISENAYHLYEKLTDWEGWKQTLKTIIENIYK